MELHSMRSEGCEGQQLYTQLWFLSVAPHQLGYTACEGYTLPLSSIGTVVIGHSPSLSPGQGEGGGGMMKGSTEGGTGL